MTPFRFAQQGQGIKQWNFVRSYQAAQRERKVKAVGSAIHYALITYVSLIADIAIQGIDEMHTYWKDTLLFKGNEKFRSNLAQCYKRSNERYEYITSLVKDKAFYADLCDAGQEFAQPYIYEMYEGFKQLYKGKCRRYNLIAHAATNFSVASAVGFRCRDLADDAKTMGVKVSGIDKFVMLEETECLANIISEFGIELDDITKPELSRIAEGIAKALQPSQILREAGLKAMALHPEQAEEFKHDTSAIFSSIKWE